MKRLYLFFALAACLPTALFAQQTESKKRSAWHLTIPEVTVIGHRPMKEIGVQKTKFDSLALKENIALSMADILTFNLSRHVALAHAGNMERDAHQQPHARHDRLFHHPVLFH